MKRKLTIEEVEKILEEAANKNFERVDSELVIARCMVTITESKLVETFNSSQKKLYEKHLHAKQRYNDMVNEKAKETKQ